MSNRITIPKRVTSKIIEALLIDLNESQKEVDLCIPENIAYRGFGVLPLTLLLTFTWMRSFQGALIVDIDGNDKNAVSRFANDYFGYVIVISVWKNSNIVDKNGDSLKKGLREHTSTMRKKLDFLENLPVNELVIPNFDHYSEELGLSHWFYVRNYKFATVPSELDNSTFRFIENIGRVYSTRIRGVVSEILDATTRIIWELVGNTQQHATKDHLDQTTLYPNTRALFLKIHDINKKAVTMKGGEDEIGLRRYYERNLEDGKNYILEISVFDSGPGLVRRFLGQEWDENQPIYKDVQIIKTCLHRGVSSVKGQDSMKKGYGLDEVLQVLDGKQGFLKIRTGRCCVYRDMTDVRYSQVENAQDIQLYDSLINKDDQFESNGWVEGTQITMAYPLKNLL